MSCEIEQDDLLISRMITKAIPKKRNGPIKVNQES